MMIVIFYPEPQQFCGLIVCRKKNLRLYCLKILHIYMNYNTAYAFGKLLSNVCGI